MAIKAVIFFVLVVFFSFQVTGQNPHDFSFKQEPLGNVLLTLAKSNNLNLIFSDSLVNGKVVSGNYSTKQLIEILYDISRQCPVRFLYEPDSSISVISSSLKKNGRFIGSVHDLVTKEPIPDCFIYSEDSRFIAQTDDAGKISLNSVPGGIYHFIIFRLGYRPQNAFVCFNPVNQRTSQFFLVPSEIFTDEIIVLNSVNQLSTERSGDTETHSLETTYNYYQDIFRSLQSVSGVDGNEISANFSIRGGHPDENKILLNNLELLSPYHFSNFFNLTSVINQDILETHHLYRDGFSAKYGNRMSGVFDMTTKTTPSGWKLSTDLTGTNAVAGMKLKEVTALFSYRTGNLNSLYRNSFGSQNLMPVYTDFFATLNTTFFRNQRVELNYLSGKDKVKLERGGKPWIPSLNSLNTNSAIWINHNWIVSPNLFVKTTLSTQQVNRISEFDFINSISSANPDLHKIEMTGVSQEITFEPKSGHLAQIGFEVQQATINYRFYEIRFGSGKNSLDSINLNLDRGLFQANIWSQYSFRPVNDFLISAGIRSDFREGTKQVLLDPRVSVLWKLTDPVLIKGSVGYYSQFQPWDRVDIASGSPVFQKPEKSIQLHSTLIMYPFQNITIESGLYIKNYYQLFDDQTFNFEDRILLFNPIRDDFNPTSGSSRGFDLMAKQTEPFHYWLVSTGFGESTLEDGKVTVPRIFFNTWKFELAFGIKTLSNFTFDLQWKNQSGVPYTEQFNPVLLEDPDISAFFVEYGRRNGKLTAGNQFLKIKAGKTFETKWVRILIYGGFYNLFDRKEPFENHTIVNQNRSVHIPINTKVEIPRVFFTGISFEGF